jgi:protein TonB
VPTQPSKPFSLDALEASIAKAAKSAPPRPSSAPRGPTRAETAPQARPNAGTGVQQSQLEGLQQLLGRLWNPCVVVGGEALKLKATFTVGDEGKVAGGVSLGGAERSPDPTTFAAARRAIDAIHQVEPYAEPFRNQRITVNFDAQQVCQGH